MVVISSDDEMAVLKHLAFLNKCMSVRNNHRVALKQRIIHLKFLCFLFFWLFVSL
jgi:hypothetical protein